MKDDAFIKLLRRDIKVMKKRAEKAYKASFVDEDSDSYDLSQRLYARLRTFEEVLNVYIAFRLEGD